VSAVVATSAATRVRVALVHDYFTQLGGAERFFEHLAALYPHAPIHASFADDATIPPSLRDRGLRLSLLQHVRRPGAPLAPLAPLMPYSFGRLDVGSCDVVLSCSSAFAHHVRVPVTATHVWYCHTPPRFLWQADEYFAERGATGVLVGPGLALARRLDRAAVRRIDVVLANSRYTAERLRSTYGREATVVHPPVPVDEFTPTDERSGRFLVVSRLRRHKRLELAIGAANALGVPLDVIGSGPDRPRLERLAGPSIRFHGRLPDAAVREAMSRCTAMIVPAAEDFGLTMVEVQASGRPPIAFARGGAVEIVRDGETGFLFAEPSVASVVGALERASRSGVEAEALVESARRFDVPVFEAAMTDAIAAARPLRSRGR